MVHRVGWLLAGVCLASPALVGSGCGDDRRTSPPTRLMTVDASARDAVIERVPTCFDNMRNGDEVDVDCGGKCGGCGLGQHCTTNDDCLRQVCNADAICVDCITPAHCPGADTDCVMHTCIGGACGVVYVESTTALANQVPGDCKVRRCNGTSVAAKVIDDTDLPDDSNPCTQDTCTTGTPGHTPLAASTSCGSGKVCDGQGHCVECETVADCPAPDHSCRVATCSPQGICGDAPADPDAAACGGGGDCDGGEACATR